jgi:hypothetical protein
MVIKGFFSVILLTPAKHVILNPWRVPVKQAEDLLTMGGTAH